MTNDAACKKCGNDVDSSAMEDQFATLTATDDEGEEKVLEELGTLKICPECGVMISKNGGYHHITCRNCSTEFCWACPFVFEAQDKDDCYDHDLDCEGGAI